eukprot:1593539-Rhodomonas_salina.1
MREGPDRDRVCDRLAMNRPGHTASARFDNSHSVEVLSPTSTTSASATTSTTTTSRSPQLPVTR